MNDVFRSFAQPLIWIRRANAGLLAAVLAILALASVSVVSAQTAELRIAELQCNDNPEVVRITNQGSADQDLTGWTLRSDPVATESFDLTAIGVLASGVSIFVESGPTAQGSYVWSTEFVLRDSDAADFARIVNANGAVVHEVKCQVGSVTPAASVTTQPTVTPAPATARPTSTPAPTVAPIGVVPEGGGPPGTGSWDGGGLMLVGGAWLLAAVFGLLVLARLRSDGAQPVIVSTGERLLPTSPPGTAAPGYARWLYLLLVLILAVIASGSTGSNDTHRRR